MGFLTIYVRHGMILQVNKPHYSFNMKKPASSQGPEVVRHALKKHPQNDEKDSLK